MEVPAKSCLFLDRDGVINHRLPGDYVRYWHDFEWLPGVLDALKTFNTYFRRIIIVTNQQGIGKGLMEEKDLRILHQQLLHKTSSEGIRIDGIYYCPDLASSANNCRKPAPAMARQAQQDFPDIDFQDAVMAGDSASDILFGKRLGMQTVCIAGNAEEEPRLQAIKQDIDLSFHSLKAYADYLQHTILPK